MRQNSFLRGYIWSLFYFIFYAQVFCIGLPVAEPWQSSRSDSGMFFVCLLFVYCLFVFTHIHKIYSLLLDLGENRRRCPPRHHVLWCVWTHSSDTQSTGGQRHCVEVCSMDTAEKPRGALEKKKDPLLPAEGRVAQLWSVKCQPVHLLDWCICFIIIQYFVLEK